MSNVNESIFHHGILGQKWGIRRFQNRDGSLTSAGRRKAQKLKNDYKSLTGKKLKGKIPDEDPSTKRIRDLSDTQLKDRINRLRAEKEAHSLERDLSGNGQKFMRSVGRDVLAPAAINAGRNIMEKVFYNGMSKALGMDKKEVRDSFQELKRATETAELKSRKAKAEKSLKDLQEQEKKKAEKQKAKEENKREPKEKVVVGDVFIFKNDKSYDRYTDKGKTVMDAVWEEKPSNNKSTALTIYDPNIRRKGKSLFNDIYD